MSRTNTTVALLGKDATGESGLTLLGRMAVEHFTLLLLQCFERETVVDLLRGAIVSARSHVAPSKPRDRALDHWSHEFGVAHQIVSDWWTDPKYVDARGRPRALPRRGRRSIESLVRQVDGAPDTDEVLHYLIRTRTVEQVGTRYLAVRRWVSTLGSHGPDRAVCLRAVADLVRTLQHNLQPAEGPAGWFQRTAENARVPLAKIPEIERHLERRGMASLGWWDAYLRRCAAERREGEPTVRFGIGVYRVEEPSGSKPRAPYRRGNGIARRDPAITPGRRL